MNVALKCRIRAILIYASQLSEELPRVPRMQEGRSSLIGSVFANRRTLPREKFWISLSLHPRMQAGRFVSSKIANYCRAPANSEIVL